MVTGGAKGIGEGISQALAAAGAHVVIADRDEAAAEKFAASLRTPGQARPPSHAMSARHRLGDAHWSVRSKASSVRSIYW